MQQLKIHLITKKGYGFSIIQKYQTIFGIKLRFVKLKKYIQHQINNYFKFF